MKNLILAYGIFFAFFLAHFMMIGMQAFCLRIFVLVTRVPLYTLAAVILAYCAIGVFSLNNVVFDIWTLLWFGVIGYTMRVLGFPLAPMILGVVLGNIAEINLSRALAISDDVTLFVHPAVGVVLHHRRRLLGGLPLVPEVPGPTPLDPGLHAPSLHRRFRANVPHAGLAAARDRPGHPGRLASSRCGAAPAPDGGSALTKGRSDLHGNALNPILTAVRAGSSTACGILLRDDRRRQERHHEGPNRKGAGADRRTPGGGGCTDKSRILTATVYISDMAKKDEMDEACLALLDLLIPPEGACLGVTLHGTAQVEFVLSAAK